jgi:hypothetical protein
MVTVVRYGEGIKGRSYGEWYVVNFTELKEDIADLMLTYREYSEFESGSRNGIDQLAARLGVHAYEEMRKEKLRLEHKDPWDLEVF